MTTEEVQALVEVGETRTFYIRNSAGEQAIVEAEIIEVGLDRLWGMCLRHSTSPEKVNKFGGTKYTMIEAII